MDMYTVFPVGLSAAEERELATFCKFASRKTHSWALTHSIRDATGVVLGSTVPAHLAAAAAFQAAGGRIAVLNATGLQEGLLAVRRPLQLDRAFTIFNHMKLRLAADPRTPDPVAVAAFQAAVGLAAAAAPALHPAPSGQDARVLPLIRASLATEAEALPYSERSRLTAVMVVDDSPVAQNYLRNRILAMGFECDVAGSGDEALLLIAQKEYALVLLDIHMQGIDGYQTCKAIKSYKRGLTVPKVVMASSKTGTIDKIRATLSGCDGYLTKPINETELARTLSLQVKRPILPVAPTTRVAPPQPGAMH
jgi:CheY-like chemotaxis protein